MIFQFSMVMTRFGAGGSGSGSGSGVGSGNTTDVIDERLRELIATKVTRGILDTTPVIFGTVKEGIMEIMEERLRSFRAETAAGHIRARTPLFWEFKASGAPKFFGVRTPLSANARLQISRMPSAQVPARMRQRLGLLLAC